MAERRKRRTETVATKPRATIHRQTIVSKNVVNDEKEDIEYDVEIFATEPAYIRVQHGVTKSIADYESLRIDVSLSVPCYKEQMEDLIEDVGERVAMMLEEELDAYGVSLHGEAK